MSMLSHAGRRVSHYQVEELLGSGGMGVVYLGTDIKLGRRVALKFLRPLSDPETRKRFMREAQAAALLDHPNLCTIFDVDETDEGEIFIAMAYYEGETLDKILARGPLDISRAMALAVQTGRGLAAAHEELIIHQDVKPGNLMVTRGDTVKILDFGTARILGGSRVSEDGSIIGTPAYMSPEVLSGRPVDQQSDIWSLGVVLYEMLTGQLPFRGETFAKLIHSVLHDKPAPPSSFRTEVPAWADRILEKSLAKHPRHRYERMEALIQDILYVQSGLDTSVITLRLPSMAMKSSIAVLPFKDMSPGQDQEYLCDGVAEEILRALSRIPDLYVASRTSSFLYKNRTADIREIGSCLNVETILEGSVRRAGDRLRISAQLVSVDTGYRLWYERYDRDIQDIFAIEDEIAESIAEALEVTLVGKARVHGSMRPTSDAEAYELYLQGRQFIHQHRRKAIEIALQNFSRVIEIAPDYARAYAGIADCHAFLCLYFGHGDEGIAAADAASVKALELDPDLSDAHASRGLALFLRRQYDEAECHLKRAIELDPRLYDPHYIFGRVCFSQGRIGEAASHFREATAIVPEAYDSWYLLGMCYRRMGDTSRARSADLECIEAVNKRVRYHPDDTRAWTMGASVLAELGEPDRASEWVARALAIDQDESIILYNSACVYVALRKHDEAITCLEKCVGEGGFMIDWARNDPDLDPLRDDLRFRALIQEHVSEK